MRHKNQTNFLCHSTFILFTLFTNSYTVVSIDILAVLFDAGETYALLPVLDELPTGTYRIVAVGTARQLVADHPAYIDISKGMDTDLNRQTRLSPQARHQIDQIKPHVVIAGMVSQWQADIVRYFNKRQIRTIGFYDSFHHPHQSHYLQDLCQHLHDVFIPMSNLRHDFKQMNPHVKIYVVGHPTIDKWQHHRIDKEKVLQQLKVDHPLIVVIGGYGKEFKQSFEALLSILKNFKQYDVRVSPHPKTGPGALDNLMEKNKSIQIIQNMATIEATLAADWIICHRSTVCVQAFSAGKSVIYFDINKGGYSNWLIKRGYVNQVNSQTALLKELSSHKPHPILSKADQLPTNTIINMAKQLIQILSESKDETINLPNQKF